jgi:hypothetical protein
MGDSQANGSTPRNSPFPWFHGEKQRAYWNDIFIFIREFLDIPHSEIVRNPMRMTKLNLT